MTTLAPRLTGLFLQAIGATGPIPGALLYTYQTGTSTPLATYSDQGLIAPNMNPLVADSNGIFPPIFLLAQAYKMVLTGANGDPSSPSQTIDPISGSGIAQPIAQGDVLGNASGIPAAPAPYSMSQMLDTIDPTPGDLLVRGPDNWQPLPPSVTPGQSLVSGVPPVWSNSPQTQTQNYADDTGLVNAYVAVLDPPIGVPQIGMPVRVKIANTNTSGTCTLLATSSGAPIAILTADLQTPGIGQLQAGAIVTFEYDGVQFQITSAAGQPTGRFTQVLSHSGPWTVNSTNGFTHGLSGTLAQLTGKLQATCAVAEGGYAPGNVLQLGTMYDAPANSVGFSFVWTGALTGALQIGGQVNGLNTAGAAFKLTPANWDLTIIVERSY